METKHDLNFIINLCLILLTSVVKFSKNFAQNFLELNAPTRGLECPSCAAYKSAECPDQIIRAPSPVPLFSIVKKKTDHLRFLPCNNRSLQGTTCSHPTPRRLVVVLGAARPTRRCHPQLAIPDRCEQGEAALTTVQEVVMPRLFDTSCGRFSASNRSHEVLPIILC